MEQVRIHTADGKKLYMTVSELTERRTIDKEFGESIKCVYQQIDGTNKFELVEA